LKSPLHCRFSGIAAVRKALGARFADLQQWNEQARQLKPKLAPGVSGSSG
jgi:hypothetical protein